LTITAILLMKNFQRPTTNLKISYKLNFAVSRWRLVKTFEPK
jgi:hypothetical protein